MGTVELRIPQVRDGIDFYPSALERGVRSEQALTLAMAERYVQGVSTRKVSKIVEELCGHSVSSTQVSACAAKLDVPLQLWRERPLGACPYLIFDARYEKVRHGGLLVDCSVLIAIGTGTDGKRTILGVNVALSEAEAHWRDFFTSLVTRGLCGTTFIVSDAYPGMAAARQAVFPAVPWQRCQFHLQQNAQAYVPRMEMRIEVADSIRSIFTSPDLASAQIRLKERVGFYAKTAPNSPPGWSLTSHKALSSMPCLQPINAACARATPLSVSTKSSNAARASPPSSPMKLPCYDSFPHCSASKATSGAPAKFTST